MMAMSGSLAVEITWQQSSLAYKGAHYYVVSSVHPGQAVQV
jgi:hypothetical protein